jgi:AraC-like DNA-binding protein
MAIADGTLAAYLGRVVDHCAGHHSEGAREASGSDWFERAKAIGLERVLAPFSVQAWAERMGLSRQHFSRRFKEASGESPADWFNRLKIGKVLELLQRPDYRQRSLADIARRCGFASQEVLGRFVKRHSGLLPSEIRSGGQRQRQGAMSSP